MYSIGAENGEGDGRKRQRKQCVKAQREERG